MSERTSPSTALDRSASGFDDDRRWLRAFRRDVEARYRGWLSIVVGPSRHEDRELWEGALVTEALDIHGLDHWARVAAVGVGLLHARLATAPDEAQGLLPAEWENALVTAAFFHDIARANEGRDRGHGERGAILFQALVERGAFTDCAPALVAATADAIRDHDSRPAVLPGANLLLQCLATADRLDRPRFGDVVDRELLYPDLDVERWKPLAEVLLFDEGSM